MKSSTAGLALLLVLTACVWSVGQTPDHTDPADNPAYTHERSGEMDQTHHGRWPGQKNRPMTEQEIREAMHVLRQIDPHKADLLTRHMQENPQRVGRALREHFPMLGRFMAMKRHDPQMFSLRISDMSLNRQAHEKARQLQEAQQVGDEVLAEAERIALDQIIAEHFDVRQQIREHELAKLEQRIKGLRDQLQQRSDNRDALIDQRIEELAGEAPVNRW